MLGERSALAHGVWLRDADIDLLARTGADGRAQLLVEPPPRGRRRAVRRLVAAGVSVALGLDDMGLADDDDMFAELRVAHVMQRVHGEPQHPRLRAAAHLRPRLGRRRARRRRRLGDRAAGAGRRGDVVVLDLRALRAPFAVGDVDIWELLVSRAQAVHVDSVIVDGRPLMLERKLQHIDRDALMQEVAAAAGVGPGKTRVLRARLARAAQAPDRRALPGAGLARRLAVIRPRVALGCSHETERTQPDPRPRHVHHPR